MSKARLSQTYKNEIRQNLQKELNLKNSMTIPKVEKIVINVGVKEAVSDSRILQKVSQIVSRISGQKPVITKARKSIAGFKIREGMPLGVMVTLRRDGMYEFLDKLINVALPNVRDFRGVTPKMDGRGNYNLGIKEWTVFPEAENTTGEKVFGMNISIHTSAHDDDSARVLLKQFNMPFRAN